MQPHCARWSSTARVEAPRLHMKIVRGQGCVANLYRSTILKIKHVNHQQCRSVLPSARPALGPGRKTLLLLTLIDAGRAASLRLRAQNRVRHRRRHVARCPVIPDPRSGPRCQKEDSPRLDLVWVSRAGTVPCRFRACLCERGRADSGRATGDEKKKKTESTRNTRTEQRFRQL